MKYEMIFGDEKLFDGAPDNCILVVIPQGDDPIFYLENNKSELRGSVFFMDDGVVKLAMRRIIKEPKRWTVADHKARRLPEFLSEILFTGGDEPEIVEYLGENGGNIWYFKRKDGAVTSAPVGYLEPIETPDEKAKREEDEFVESITKCTASDGYSTGFLEGLHAAYRKLKGGE